MKNMFVTVDPTKSDAEFLRAYDRMDPKGQIRGMVRSALMEKRYKCMTKSSEVAIPHCASHELKPPALEYGKATRSARSLEFPKPDCLILPLALPDEMDEEETQRAFEDLRAAVPGAVSVDADIAFQPAYMPQPAWCPTRGGARGFGSRGNALKAIGQDFLASKSLNGKGVNVVIVDQGLDKHRLGKNYGGGWQVAGQKPGKLKLIRGVTGNGHGMLIARNLLSVAPEARIFDLPLIPDRIVDVEAYLSKAYAYLSWVLQTITRIQECDLIDGPWIIVNAWAIFDLTTEYPRGNYSRDSRHCFNRLMRQFTERDIDVIFAAGNCGEFCPDRRCGLYNTGPGRSIFGAHAHASVLTVGAMLSDGLWIGSSSQGPGPEDQAPKSNEIERLTTQKPDLCAPSFFVDPDDAHAFNGGTSTACALAAGVVAALRSAHGFEKIGTEHLFETLRRTSIKADAGNWDPRLGFGLINAEAGFQELSKLKPKGAAPAK